MSRVEHLSEDVTLYLGDCLEIMPTLGVCADIAFTSPPYNMGLSPTGGVKGGTLTKPSIGGDGKRFREGYGLCADAMPALDYDLWQRACLSAAFDAVRLAVFYNHRPRVEFGLAKLPLGMDFGPLPLRQIIIWDRGTGIDVNLRSFCTRQEWILLFARPEFALKDHSASGQGDVWRIGPDVSRLGHPAPFPVELPRRAILTADPQSVLDPFMGSGTTGAACVQEGRGFVGIELEPKFFDIACRRISTELRRPRLQLEPITKPVQEAMSL